MATVQTKTVPVVPGSTSRSLGEHARDYGRRLRGGDLGSLPAVLGLVVLSLIFGVLQPEFFSPINFANLLAQGAQVSVIAMGLVFVLLLGEIDLSAGFASGVCAAILAVMITWWHLPWYLAVPTAVLTGVVIGLVLGLLVSIVRIPSFVVTLAAFLAFQGIALLILKNGTNISVDDPVIVSVENKNLPVWLGWALLAVAVLGYLAVQLLRVRSRAARGLATDPMSLVALRVGALALVGGLAVYALNLERSLNPPHVTASGRILGVSLRGVPIVVPVIVVLLVVWTFILGRTAYGRHIYAVGGNREAARRAGINVDGIRISAFVICSALASIGGIIAASRARSVDPNTGGSTILLYAVGAAVIGGTSLFGGKGRVIDAILGGAVVAVIINGMGLLGVRSDGIKYVVTGIVLLAAAGVDALSRRRAAATGLR
jgi:D-xylose transport system permease protein